MVVTKGNNVTCEEEFTDCVGTTCCECIETLEGKETLGLKSTVEIFPCF